MADLDNLKGNSFKEREAAEEEKKEKEKVVEGEAKIRKKNELEKVVDAFLPEDRAKTRDHILNDLLVPAVRNFVIDMVTVLLKGDTSSSQKRRGTFDTPSYRDYNNDYGRQKETRPAARTAFKYDDVILSSRADAEAVLDTLNDTIDRYGYATVADLYEYSGLRCTYPQSKYGWSDIRDADIQRLRADEWLIRMPRVSPIN